MLKLYVVKKWVWESVKVYKIYYLWTGMEGAGASEEQGDPDTKTVVVSGRRNRCPRDRVRRLIHSETLLLCLLNFIPCECVTYSKQISK